MKECTHCGGPNAPENRVCDYCGMGFDESTIPEGSIDPREQAKKDREAWIEANREKDLVEFNLDSKNDQNVTINMPNGQSIRINDPVEKAAAIAGSVLTGSAASAMKKIGSGKIRLPSLDADDPRFGPGGSASAKTPKPGAGKKASGCLGCAIAAAVAGLLVCAVLIFVIF